MLFVEEDKSAPLKYLEFAVAKPNVDPEAFFYLGKAYHLNYRFEEAKNRYTEFKEKGNSKQVQSLEVDQHIKMCENGSNLLSNITDLAVLDKKTLNRSDFFRSYDVSSFGGKIITKPEDFELSYDAKVDDQDIMYLDRNADKLFYASYGDKGKAGKDIYFSKKLPDGTWGEPQSIGSTINTSYDEDYPFFNPETNTLYFSSKGHNSMGGYDVFKSFYDETSNTWGKPVNLDYAVNTPDDENVAQYDKAHRKAMFDPKVDVLWDFITKTIGQESCNSKEGKKNNAAMLFLMKEGRETPCRSQSTFLSLIMILSLFLGQRSNERERKSLGQAIASIFSYIDDVAISI